MFYSNIIFQYQNYTGNLTTEEYEAYMMEQKSQVNGLPNLVLITHIVCIWNKNLHYITAYIYTRACQTQNVFKD